MRSRRPYVRSLRCIIYLRVRHPRGGGTCDDKYLGGRSTSTNHPLHGNFKPSSPTHPCPSGIYPEPESFGHIGWLFVWLSILCGADSVKTAVCLVIW